MTDHALSHTYAKMIEKSNSSIGCWAVVYFSTRYNICFKIITCLSLFFKGRLLNQTTSFSSCYVFVFCFNSSYHSHIIFRLALLTRTYSLFPKKVKAMYEVHSNTRFHTRAILFRTLNTTPRMNTAIGKVISK